MKDADGRRTGVGGATSSCPRTATDRARVFVSERRSGLPTDAGRTLLVDDPSVLLSSVDPSPTTVRQETAIVSDGGIGGRIVSPVEELPRSRRPGIAAASPSPDPDPTGND